MSDIAPFVAAVIRDKVVADLKDENDKLREQLSKCRAVEITGEGGNPVYAKGKFDEGTFAGNPNLWDVSLTEVQPCPLASLEGVEIRLGGACKAFFGDGSVFEGFFDAPHRDHENGRGMSFFSASGLCWLTVVINGWPRERWSSDDFQLAGVDRVENGELFHVLTREVAAEAPNKTVAFCDVSFINKTVSGALESLQLGQEDTEEARQNREMFEFQNYVLSRMRETGYDGPPSTFLSQVAEVMGALLTLGITDTERENEINEIIELHSQTHENTEPGNLFEDHINRIVAQIREDVESANVETEST